MKRLWIRLPNWLGDVMMARPLLHALRARFPDVPRMAIGRAGPLDLLRAEDPGLECREWPADPAGREPFSAALRREGPATAILLPISFSSAWFAWRAGARPRVGYSAEGRTPLLTTALPRVPRGAIHLSEEYLALGAVLGASAGPTAPLPVPAEWRERVRARLAPALGDRPYLVVAPGATYGPAKRWAPGRFAEVAAARAAAGDAIVLAGAPADRFACDAVAAALRELPVRLDGATSLPELAALLAGARAVVSNDSGLAHVAGAVGAPTVVVFGSTSSAWTAPLGPRVRVVQRAPVCSPCFRRTCAIGYRCLEAVPATLVERVVAEAAA